MGKASNQTDLMHGKVAAGREAHELIKPLGAGRVGADMKEGQIALRTDLAAQCRHQMLGKAAATEGVIDADRADLAMACELQPLARHRDQARLLAQAEISAHFASARTERSGLGARDQGQHLGQICGGEALNVAKGLDLGRGGLDHLHDLEERCGLHPRDLGQRVGGEQQGGILGAAMAAKGETSG